MLCHRRRARLGGKERACSHECSLNCSGGGGHGDGLFLSRAAEDAALSIATDDIAERGCGGGNAARAEHREMLHRRQARLGGWSRRDAQGGWLQHRAHSRAQLLLLLLLLLRRGGGGGAPYDCDNLPI